MDRSSLKLFEHNIVDIPQLKQINTDAGRRYETPSGTLYPSITTILSHKSKPFIDAWRKRVGADVANKISNKASTRGTKIHQLCEDILNNKLTDDSSLNYIDKEMFQKFRPLLDDIGVINSIESKLYSDHLRLAGQVDCIAEYKGKVSIIDFKTSMKRKTRSMCENYFIQCCAYAIMFEERTGIPVSQLVILMAVEGEEPIVFCEKRDDYVAKLLEARDDYEAAYK